MPPWRRSRLPGTSSLGSITAWGRQRAWVETPSGTLAPGPRVGSRSMTCADDLSQRGHARPDAAARARGARILRRHSLTTLVTEGRQEVHRGESGTVSIWRQRVYDAALELRAGRQNLPAARRRRHRGVRGQARRGAGARRGTTGPRRPVWPADHVGPAQDTHSVSQPVAARAQRAAGAHGTVS